MAKQTLFRLLGILTMGSLYLPLLRAIFPFLFASNIVFLIIWLVAIFIYYPKIYISKSMILIYCFILIYFIFSVFWWQNRTVDASNNTFLRWIMVRQIGFAILGILILKYFLYARDFRGIRITVLFAVFFMVFTSLLFLLFPDIFSKFMNLRGEDANNNSMNSYGFFASIAFLSPIVVYYIKLKKIKLLYRILWFTAWLITVFATAQDNRTTPLIFSILFFIISFFNKSKKPIAAFIISATISLIVINFFNHQISIALISLGNLFEDTLIDTRLTDLASAFETSDFDPESGTTYTSGVRLSLVFKSLNSFFDNPLIGGGFAGGHAFWIDILGIFGLIGIFPWILIFVNQAKQNFALFKDDYSVYYLASFISIITFGFFKSGIQSPQIMICFFFLLPGLYFLTKINSIPRKRAKKLSNIEHKSLLISNRK